MTVTHVTAYLDLKDGSKKTRSHETCFQHFREIAKAGIPTVVFLSRNFEKEAFELSSEFPTICVEFIDIEELETYKEAYRVALKQPSTPAPEKDTKHFMILMNAKIECMKRAIDKDPFRTSHFAWIDFSIHYVFRDPLATVAKLREQASGSFVPCLVFPGCWEKDVGYSYVRQSIHWRFCGGFFLGDKDSLLRFSELYRKEFAGILEKSGVMLWEVNVWSILEKEYGWNPSWYKAGHDDSIVNVPVEYLRQLA